ncbi:MAG: Crp/Fnr family transcriptional regulator [Bryobacteraceae bacterium]
MFPLLSYDYDELLKCEGITKIRGNRFDPLYLEAAEPDFVYIVESGLVKTSVRGPADKEIVLHIFPKGEIFGVVAAVLQRQHEDRATMLTEGTIAAIPKSAFDSYCQRNPNFWNYLTKLIAYRKTELHRKIQLLVLHDVEYRLVSCLIDLAEMADSQGTGGAMPSIPLSQEDLAVVIGATRETTSNKLNIMSRSNHVILGRKKVVVPSIERLRGLLVTSSAANA